MISWRISNVPKEDVVFPWLPYWDWRCSQPRRRRSQKCCWHSQTCHWHSSTCHQCSQTCHPCPQSCHRWSRVHPGARNVLYGARRCSQTFHNHSHGTHEPVIRDTSYSEGRPESSPRVWYSPAIDTSMFTLHILSDTPAGLQRLKYVLPMKSNFCAPSHNRYIIWEIHMSVECAEISNWPHSEIHQWSSEFPSLDSDSVSKMMRPGDMKSVDWCLDMIRMYS